MLITFLCCDKNTMTNAAYRNKGSFGLTVPEGQGSITCKWGKQGSRASGSHGGWSNKLRPHILNSKARSQEGKLKMMQAFKLSQPVSSDILQQDIPKQTHQLGFQMPETTGMFLIQTIAAAASMRAPKLQWKRIPH